MLVSARGRVLRARSAERAIGCWSCAQRRAFRLDPAFLQLYEGRAPPFGFNGLGELVFYRTYARPWPGGGKERWRDTVARVVNGTFTMQERWMKQQSLGWNQEWAQQNAQDMYERIFAMKFLPPGRGLWAMGTSITEERGLYAALNNCAFVSTEELASDPAEPFAFLMDAAMLGVGVGFDTMGAGSVVVFDPTRCESAGAVNTFVVPDSREGWVESLSLLLRSYLANADGTRSPCEFDYSAVRPAGVPIKGFGGLSSGPGPLRDLHDAIHRVLGALHGAPLTVTAIVDIMNLVGKCVVSGNVRRTAEIAFGDPSSEEYVGLKDYSVNPHRADYGWTSNNSVFAELGMSYSKICERIALNGEPGFAWLDNMRSYGRMNGKPDGADRRAAGGNPCLEQTLESYEMCCLVETFPARHDGDLDDFKQTLDSALLYAKTVTLGQTHWPQSNRVMLRNRRIGCSMSGLAQYITAHGTHKLRQWAEEGYERIQLTDAELSDRFAVPRSIKTTCIKPSGTVSLLAGATPGMHFPESRYYIRRIRLSKGSELVAPLLDAGYDIEPCLVDQNTVVVSVPVDAGEGIRTAKELSMWEQLGLAAFLQRHWADNQVSCTVTFNPETEGSQLPHALDYFQYHLKGVSFLPRLDAGAYDQMPYEEISASLYDEMRARLLHLELDMLYADSRQEAPSFTPSEMPDAFCDGAACDVPLAKIRPGA